MPVGLWGIAAAFGVGVIAQRIVKVVAPAVGERIRPLAVVVIREGIQLSRDMLRTTDSVREDLEDLVATAKAEVDANDTRK